MDTLLRAVFMKQILITSDSWDQSSPATQCQTALEILQIIPSETETMDLIQQRNSVPNYFYIQNN